MKTYSIKVDTQNLSKSFIYFEDKNFSYDQALNELKKHQSKFKSMIDNNIMPVVYDDRNRSIRVRKIYIIENKKVVNNA